MIDEELKLAVKHGVEWLDENHPGWERKINLRALDMNDCEHCVIGQAVGDYWNTISNAAGPYTYNDLPWSVAHGFDVESGHERPHQYKDLEVLWTEVVKERLG